MTTMGRQNLPPLLYGPVGWGSRIHQLHICRGVRTPRNECPRYDIKQSDGEVPVLLELWGMRSSPSLSSLPGSLWPGFVTPHNWLVLFDP